MEQIVSTTYGPEEFKKLLSEAVKSEIEKLPVSAPQPETEFITRQNTASLLLISLPTLNDWTKRGLISAYRIGSRIRYKKGEVLESLKQVQTIKYNRDL